MKKKNNDLVLVYAGDAVGTFAFVAASAKIWPLLPFAFAAVSVVDAD